MVTRMHEDYVSLNIALVEALLAANVTLKVRFLIALQPLVSLQVFLPAVGAGTPVTGELLDRGGPW